MMSSAQVVPYLGSKISLITRKLLRYEGILISINVTNHTVTLADTRKFGTEDRVMGVNAVNSTGEFLGTVSFQGKQIKDITVSELAGPEDPAIVAIHPFHGSNATSRGGSGALFPGEPSLHPSMMHHPPHLSSMNGGNTNNGGSNSNGLLPPVNRTGAGDQSGQIPLTPYMMGGNHQQPLYTGSGYPSHRMDYYNESGAPNYMGGHERMEYGQGRMNNGRKAGQYMLYYMGENSGHYMHPNHVQRGSYGRYNNYNNHSRIVGELEAQPNSSLKVLVEKAFNFEEANAKLDKSTLSQVNLPAPDINEDAQTDVSKVKRVYDKDNSFFDQISCESLDRQNGHHLKLDPTKQRQLDLETFGSSARQGRGGQSTGFRVGRYGYYHNNHRPGMYGMNHMQPSTTGLDYGQLNPQLSGYHQAAVVGDSQF